MRARVISKNALMREETKTTPGNSGPLEGMMVIEAANFMSGPFVGMMLADLGANVLKIEPPGGDPFRSFGRPTTPVSSVWAMVNRGKTNAVVDLKRNISDVLDLARDADVFVSNWRPSVARRLGIDDDVLAECNSRLVRCWITGVGPTGPRSNDPAFDTIAQALSGMTDAISSSDVPQLSPGYPVDKMTAAMATQSILAALVARGRSGDGDRLDVSMLDVASYMDFPELLRNRAFLADQPQEARSSAAVAQRPFPASDGWFVVATVTGQQIKGACAAMGHPEWAKVVFAQPDSAAIVQAMFDLFAPVSSAKPRSHWLEQFRRHDVPAAPCLQIDEHFREPQVIHNNIYAIEEWPNIGPVRVVRYPTTFARFGHLRSGVPPISLPKAPEPHDSD